MTLPLARIIFHLGHKMWKTENDGYKRYLLVLKYILENLAYFNAQGILFFNQKSSQLVLLHFEVEFCKFLKC